VDATAAGEYLIVVEPRPEAVRGLDDLWAPVLRREPLGGMGDSRKEATCPSIRSEATARARRIERLDTRCDTSTTGARRLSRSAAGVPGPPQRTSGSHLYMLVAPTSSWPAILSYL
jgi:hypothetical protein